MSWLYTIVFTGLLFSSQGGSFSATDRSIQNCQVVPSESPKGDETERFEQTYPLSANGRVNVSNVNGSITIEAWDRNEVKLEYTKVADSKERLADVEIRIDSKADSFSVETDYGDWKKGNMGDRWKNGGKLTVEYKLMVPRGAILDEIETVNGSVVVSNFTNITKVSAVNGSVNATNLRGTAKLSTVNGEVVAGFDRLENGTKISLETVNGKANLIIPSDANATVKADSLNGDITNDFGLPVRKGKYVGRDLYGRLGSGEVQIRLNSVNGGLSIGHKNDGKSVSPAVNLLPQKDKDDEDWDKDDEDNSGFKAAKVNKDVAKAIKESTKVSAKAMADAEVQINTIQPEIAKITAESVRRAAETMKSDEYLQSLKDAQIVQSEVLAKMADASFFPVVPRVEKKSESIPVKGTSKVTVDAKGCSVTVRGWDKSEVQYRVVQFSNSRDRSPLKIDEAHGDSFVTIKVQNPNLPGGPMFNDSNKVRIEVYVPRKSNLKINATGEIRLDGVSGDVDLSGGDESINVRDGDGKLQVSSSEGRIRVIGFRGEVVAESSAGMINLEGDFKRLKAKSNDGAIFLTLPENTQADVEATCDEIQGEGIAVTRVGGNEKLGKYRIGNGGASYQVETQGEIHVRGASTLNSF